MRWTAKMRTFVPRTLVGLLAVCGGAPPALGCVGHEAEGDCPEDFICHFEGDFCGVTSGDITSCDGAWGEGLCSGGNGRVDLGDGDHFSRDTLGIECQVKFTDLPAPGSNAAALVSKYLGHHPEASEWALFVEDEADSHVWMLCGDGTLCIRSATGLVQTGQLYCVRAVLRATYAELYVDDALVASGAIARNSGNAGTPVIVANTAPGGHDNPFHGMIDEVRVGCLSVASSAENASWGSVKALFR